MIYLDKSLSIIKVRVLRSEKIVYGEVSYQKAMLMVEEEAAIILSSSMILKLLHREYFGKFILERDQYICRFCHQSGYTVDHLRPRSVGGISSPKNCVACCSECNFLKLAMNVEEFVKKYHKFHPILDWDLSIIKNKII